MDTHQAARRARVADTSITYPDDLPIVEWRPEILAAIQAHQVVIVAGETGSGKSTQLPKMCLELGRGIVGRIGHTQPRRIAARSIAERVADELGTEVGGLVGYTVRFTDEVAAPTAVKVMTDGILLNEIHRDPLLRQYDTIIVDEAHERSLNVDFLLGYLKQLLPERPDLRVVITSATIDTERFSELFDEAPVIEVAGRTYPVEVRYRPVLDGDGDEPRDQSQAICDAVGELAHEGTGDILVFCSGEREIRDAVDALSELGLRHTEILPLFGRLSASEQHRVFAPHTGRRIVVATNVAETSLTVPGIRYVVDTGMARISRYSRRTKVQQLPIEPISQASARQRAGRCGRLGPGICIRLYDEADLVSRPEYTDPEILRTSLASVMLQMEAAGLGPIARFPFIDPPDTRAIKDGTALLEEIGAVRPGEEGTSRWLTDIGRTLARLPLDPRLGRMLLAANEHACLDEVLTIVSALSIQDPRERPTGKEQAADEAHRRFADERSDFLGWLRLWDHISTRRASLTSSGFRRMCGTEYLNWRRVREWQDLRAQLRRVTRELGMHPNREPAAPELIHEALLTGLLSHVGRKDPDGWEYRGARGSRFSIRPRSALFRRAPEWVMAAELTETTRTWATGVAPIDVATIERVGGHLVRRAVSDPWWDAERGAAVARQTSSLFGMTLSADRIVMFDRFDRETARDLFIRHALVNGEWSSHHAFAQRNAERILDVLAVEDRERREDLLATDDSLAAFFAARIPADVTSVRAFDAWWKDARERTPHLLDLTPADLIAPGAGVVDEDAFPPVWRYGDLDLDLEYVFDPTSASDGVTVEIPIGALDLVDPSVFEWSIPGLRAELVAALLRSLPKRLRREFAPLGDTADQLAVWIDPGSGRLIESIARELNRRGDTVVDPDDFDLTRVPAHLRPHYRIVDGDGDVVEDGDDLDELRVRLREQARAALDATQHPMERSGVTSWDFGTLPGSVAVGPPEREITVHPALVDDGDSVSIRLMATADERDDATWHGLRRLVILALPSPARLMRSVLDALDTPAVIAGSPYGSAAEWMDDCLACAIDAEMARVGGAWDRESFERLVADVRSGLADTLEQVGTTSAGILEALHRVNRAIDDTADVFTDVLDDVERQLDRFVFPGFLSAVGIERLDDVRRYLDAIDHRLERLPENPERDRERMATVTALEAEHDRLSDVLAWTPELVDLAWALQELRVGLFAESIGTRGTVSEKRIRAALDALLT